jgi:FemAB-related protein (PEP-CTERM system-associated)
MLMESTETWTVRTLAAATEAAWDAFVRAQGSGTFFHLAGWRRVLEAAFGHATHYLYAERGGEIGAVLPLAHLKSRLFGNLLSSTPFCSYGGPLATYAAAHDVLIDAACDLADDLGVDYLELRNRETSELNWPAKTLYVTFRTPLAADPQANFKAIGAKRRNMVRRGERAGLSFDLDQDIDRHYRIYAEMVRNLGTPVFSRRYLALLKQVFGDDCEILTVTQDNRPLAGMMSFYFRDEMLIYYGGGVRAARALGANDFLYWALMRRGCERGARVFDAGRSRRGTGSFAFKTYWGWEPAPLHYCYKLVRRKTMPNLSPSNPKYRLLVDTWKRLPLPVTTLVGPLLARNLG